MEQNPENFRAPFKYKIIGKDIKYNGRNIKTYILSHVLAWHLAHLKKKIGKFMTS